MRSALERPGVRAGGGRASLANLGVLVTYIDMPSSPAVGVRRGVRIRAPTHIPAYGMAVREDALRPVDARARQYSGAPASSRRHGHSAGARFGIESLYIYLWRNNDPYVPAATARAQQHLPPATRPPWAHAPTKHMPDDRRTTTG